MQQHIVWAGIATRAYRKVSSSQFAPPSSHYSCPLPSSHPQSTSAVHAPAPSRTAPAAAQRSAAGPVARVGDRRPALHKEFGPGPAAAAAGVTSLCCMHLPARRPAARTPPPLPSSPQPLSLHPILCERAPSVSPSLSPIPPTPLLLQGLAHNTPYSPLEPIHCRFSSLLKHPRIQYVTHIPQSSNCEQVIE